LQIEEIFGLMNNPVQERYDSLSDFAGSLAGESDHHNFLKVYRVLEFEQQSNEFE
jgi:hypothetical protein